MMIQYIRNLDRPEGSQTHMKCDVRDLDAHFLNLCQQLFREMQTCCRCSRRSFMFRINRLIAVLVLQTVCDVWRQRHLAELIENLLEDPVILKLDQAVSFIDDIIGRLLNLVPLP